MTGVKISALPSATTLAGTETVPVVQNGVTSTTTVSQISTYASGTGNFLLAANNLSDLADSEAAMSNLDFLQSGTGAVARTVRSKLRDVVHATDFGAVGDGTTDDTAALQAAIDAVNAAGGGIVDCSGGRWLIDTANLNLKKGVQLVGSWRTFGRPGSNAGNFSTVESAFVLNSTYTISIQEYDAGIQGMVILRKGLTAPSTIRTAVDAVTAFAGTAITVGNGVSDVAADCWLSNLFIVGFAQGITSDWSSRGRFSYINGDCTAGIVIANSYDMQHLSNVHFWPFLTSAYAPTTYAVSGAADNGSGLVRLTIASNAVLATGDRVTVKDVGGATGATGPFTITRISATQIDLQGSTFGGVYTTGGTVYLSAWYRSGIGVHLNTSADWGQADTCFTYNYATGIKITDCDNGTLMNCGTDCYYPAADTSTRGIWVKAGCARIALVGCKTAATGVNVDIDTNETEGDLVALTSHRSWGAVTYAARITDGAAKFVNCGFQTSSVAAGVVRIEDAAEEPLFIGGDMESVTFSYASTASPRPTLIGVRGQTPVQNLVVNAVSGSSAISTFEGHNSTPAANDTIFKSYKLTSSTGVQTEVIRESYRATAVTNGAMTSQMFWALSNAGTFANVMVFKASSLGPLTHDGMALGESAAGWSDLFMATGSVINFQAGNYTVTHTAGLLTLSGALTTSGAVINSSTTLHTGATTMGAFNYAADAGSTDDYAITLAPAPAAYVTGMEVTFKAATANTGAATLNVNGLGAKTIVKAVSTALANNDILANMFCVCKYDGTNFVLINPRAL